MAFEAFLRKRQARFSRGSVLAILISSGLHIGSAAALGFWGGGGGDGAGVPVEVPFTALRWADEGVPVRLWDTPVRLPGSLSSRPEVEDKSETPDLDALVRRSAPRQGHGRGELRRRPGNEGVYAAERGRLEVLEPPAVAVPDAPERDLVLARGPEENPVVPPPIEPPPLQAASAPPEPAYVPEGEAGGLRIYEKFPRLPRELSERGSEYLVSARICVSASGQVEDVDLLRPSSSQLDGALIEAMGSWRYSPWKPQGQARPFCHPIQVRYIVR